MPKRPSSTKAQSRQLPARLVLTVNSGSSSIKFALYPADSPATPLLSGGIERIGLSKTTLTTRAGSRDARPRTIDAPDHQAAAEDRDDSIDHSALA